MTILILFLLALTQTTTRAAVETSEFRPRPPVPLEDLNFEKNNSNEINISFGSCYGLEDAENHIFKAIAAIEEKDREAPDLFIWGGDAAYLDKFEGIYDDFMGAGKEESINDLGYI